MDDIKVLTLVNGRFWIGKLISYSGKEATVSAPLEIFLVPTEDPRAQPQVSLVPALFFNEDESAQITVTCLHDPYSPEQRLKSEYIRRTTGLHVPVSNESKLILG